MKRLQVMITQKCNSHCSYCMVSRDNKDFNQDLIPKINETIELYGIDAVLFFGGEPLLLDDLCYEIRDTLADGFKTILPTNGKQLKDSHVEDFKNVLISSNGTEETCLLTGQAYIPQILEIKDKDKCTIGMRITPQSVHNMSIDFDYFYNAGFTKFNIIPIIEMDWNKNDYELYKKSVKYIISKIPRENIWTWKQGGICVPYQGTVCLDQDGEIWSCARYCSDRIKVPKIPESSFRKCLNCELRPWCFHNCHYLNQTKTGSAVMPYKGICEFAELYKEIFGSEGR